MKDTLNKAFNQLIDKLESWFTAIVENIPNLLLAIIVMAGSYFVAKYVSKIVNKLIEKRVSQKSISNMISRLSAIIVVGVGLFLALGIDCVTPIPIPGFVP